MVSREQWSALWDSSQVREILDYAEWLAADRQESVTSALIDVLRAGKSRVEQLRRYNLKKKDPAATFRPYAPLKSSDSTRIETKRRAEAEGVAPAEHPLCGFTDIRGRRCWLAPHAEHVPHRF